MHTNTNEILDFLIAFQCSNVVEVQRVQIILICIYLQRVERIEVYCLFYTNEL